MRLPFVDAVNAMLHPNSALHQELTVRDELRRNQLRLLVFADEFGPTVQINWMRPLKAARVASRCALWLIEESRLEAHGKAEGAQATERAMDALVAQMRPDAIVASRYGGTHASSIIRIANRRRLPLIFHIDDNLLSVPPELGPSKVKKYSAPERRQALSDLMTQSTLVYCSTSLLLEKLQALGIHPKAHFVGEIAGAADPVATPASDTGDHGPLKIGYMASSSHSHDLEPLVPVIERILANLPNVRFELFGTIAPPPRLAEKIAAHHPAIRDYDVFVEALAALKWDIGLAPLRLTEFNLAKTNTKWIEYAAAGVPVVCSKHPVYTAVCAAGGAMAADSPQEWDHALRLLIEDRARRLALRRTATEHLQTRYSVSALTRQVSQVLSVAAPPRKTALLA